MAAHLKLSFRTTVSISKLFFFSFSFLFYFLSITTGADDGVSMSNLLKALTGTPPGWSQNTSFCTWKGVKCGTTTNNRVTSIDLTAHSLTGTLPAGLNSLSFLKYLQLSKNALTGPLPSLANLTMLKEVDLSHNNFTSIPNEYCFQGLTSSQILTLGKNTNLAPWTFPNLSHSLKLQGLDLRATNIFGSLPDTFHLFHSLLVVLLSNNNMTGTLPNSLARSSVSILWLNNQKVGLSGSIGVLSKMMQLTAVWLDYNKFTGPIPDLSNCTFLLNLQLRNNLLRGEVPPSLTRLCTLKDLSLENNLFRGSLPEFGRSVNVTFYPINRLCPHSGDGLCDQTVLLDIAEAYGNPFQLANSWKWNSPFQDWSFITCEGEKVIDVKLARQGLTGTISYEFAKLTNLKNLDLSGNHLNGSIPEILANLSQLEVLDVSYNNLSGVVPIEFPSRVKVNITGNPLLRSSVGGHGGSSSTSPSKTTKGLIAGASAATTIGVVMLIVIIWNRERCFRLVQRGFFKKTGTSLDYNVEDFMKTYSSLAPKQYSYSEVKKMTRSFQDKLGQGGFGVVYKATLPNGCHVAVKIITEPKGSGEEFINEVTSISKTSYVNIVSLLGFCYERNKRALIYEFMPNESLDQFIYKRGSPNAFTNLDWNILYKIAIGIAKGIEYLHRGCSTRIVHLDIKPQNILLDEDFCPKISDFGLAKLCKKKESIVSILGTRGTIGYIAPEVLSRRYGRVSHKSDVYSYGMLILEMVGVRKNHDGRGSHTSEIYFPVWIYKDLEEGNIHSSCSLITEEEIGIVRKMTTVSLWCIQTNPRDRPSTSEIIEMLEGPLQSVPFPPKPATYSPKIIAPLKFSGISSSNKNATNSITRQKDVPSIQMNSRK